jgi:DNA-directed RNA polymerase subunit RPC12/RpoP
MTKWHSDSCYICFDDFDEQKARCISYDCIHAVCMECWDHMIKEMDPSKIKRCPYCKSVQQRNINGKGSIVKTSNGDNVIAPDIVDGKYLCRDFVQVQLIKQQKY